MKIGKILVIDDNEDHRNAIEYLLQKENYIVFLAQNGKIGLELLSQHDDIQVIIVDLAMLDLSGVGVLKEIKDWPHPLRRIVLTAHDEVLPFAEAEKLNVFSYLNKPPSKHTLLFTVKSAFNDLYREKLESELLSITKEWQALCQNPEDFFKLGDQKVKKFFSQIESIDEKLRKIKIPTQSKFNEVVKIINQIVKVKGEMSAKLYDSNRSGKPKVFIGSSSESLEVAEAIGFQLKNDAKIKIWKNNFELSANILDSLLGSLQNFDFAIFILGADDFIVSRDIPSKITRDNIFFEIGLFMGQLGRSKVFLVYDTNDNIKIPSDFAGVVLATYDGDDSIDDAVNPVCYQIRKAMKKYFR
jgi:predicted nucleotide-binding protein/DNA-binding NarL/FixJ family response regulator